MRRLIYSIMLWGLLLSTAVVSAGCSPTLEALVARLTPSPTVPSITKTIQSIETLTPEPVECVYVWSTRSLPDVSTEVNQSFRLIGLQEIEVDASAYGEDCLDSNTNQVVNFIVLQTDFYFNVVVVDIADEQFLGDSIERIATIMEAYQPGSIPGSTPGNFGVTFTNGSETLNLWFPRTKLENLLEEKVKGSELFEALNNQ